MSDTGGGGSTSGLNRGDYAVGTLVPGTPYVVERLLERGGQSVVYEVRNAIGKRFVLKVVRPTLFGLEFASRLEDEAKVLVRLEHPNIVTAHELGATAEEPPRVFVVMEALRGRNLRDVLDRRKRVDLPSALEIGASIADALAHTHGIGVVHLDVKPANVFVHVRTNGTPVVKLLDFGFMRVLEPNHTTTSLAGTPTYGAPEQLLGEGISPRTDIYSLGLVLYELLTGRRPFPIDDGIMAVVAARLSRPAPPLSRWSLLPSEVEELVMACIERRPEHRPEKASDVARALWDARARALRRRRSRSGDLTVESLVGLVSGAAERTAQPPLLAPVAKQSAVDATAGTSSDDVAETWFASAPVEDAPAPAPRRITARAAILSASLALLAIAAGLGWRGSHRAPLGAAGVPVTASVPLTSAPATIPIGAALAAPENVVLAPPPSSPEPVHPVASPMHPASRRHAARPAGVAPAPTAAASARDPLLDWLEKPGDGASSR